MKPFLLILALCLPAYASAPKCQRTTEGKLTVWRVVATKNRCAIMFYRDSEKTWQTELIPEPWDKSKDPFPPAIPRTANRQFAAQGDAMAYVERFCPSL